MDRVFLLDATRNLEALGAGPETSRDRIEPNQARIEAALTSVKLL